MNHRVWIAVGLVWLAAACAEAGHDPKTPAGAHHRFTQSLIERNYLQTYDLIATSSRANFRSYITTTREVVSIIRSRYPRLLQQAAIDNLSIPLAHGSFSYEDIANDSSDARIFSVLCQKLFGDSSGTFSLAREFAARADEIRYESEDSASVLTLAGEQLLYVREPDGVWRTREIFGKNFDHLVRVSRANLDITLSNADLYDQ